MDAHLPRLWFCVSDQHLLCGFAPGAPYAVYVTDFASVWYDVPTLADIAAKARSLGVVGFGTTQINYLLEAAQKAFGKGDFDLQKENDSYSLSFVLSENLTWSFSLRLADSLLASSVFAHLTATQYANHAYLLTKISSLERSLAAKDNYITYLEENYKTINGSELVDKFKRQHKDEASLLSKYDPDALSAVADSAFAEKSPGLWDVVQDASSDTKTWLAASECVSLVKEEPLKAEDVSMELPDPEIKSEPDVKMESDLLQVSPRRRRVGQLIRKRPRSSSPAGLSPSTSPSKRTRVGTINRH